MADIKLSDIFGGVGGMSDQVIVNKNDITTLKSDVATKVNKAGDTITGQLNLNGNKSVTFGNTNNYINISGNLLYLAANNSAGYVTIEGAANPKVKVGANIYDLYHGGNKQLELPVRDVRGAARAPNYFTQKSVTSWFNETGNPTATWYSGINVCGWQSADYAAWQLASYASSGTSDNRLWFRTGRADAWNSWYRVYHEGDKPQPGDVGAVAKAGDTGIGDLSFSSAKRVFFTAPNDLGGAISMNEKDFLGVNNAAGGAYLGGFGAYLRSGNDTIHPSFERGGTRYYLYHEGNKPTPTEIGTMPINGQSTAQNGLLNLIATNYALGKCMYQDVDFLGGSNNLNPYNNTSGSGITLTWESNSTAPNSSKKVVKITHNPAAGISPGYGGFITNMPAAANKIFVQVFVAKLESGREWVTAENSMGVNSKTYWATSNKGTGKWERYIRVTMCGDSGSFSGGGHTYVTGGSSSTFYSYLAEATVYDITDIAIPYNKYNKPSPGDINTYTKSEIDSKDNAKLNLSGGTLTGALAFAPANGISIIDFQNTGANNDRGWIKHFNASSADAHMDFCVSDDPTGGSDYFAFGAASGNGTNIDAPLTTWVHINRTASVFNNRVVSVGSGNDYASGAVELKGNGSSIYPTLGFHQPGSFAGSIQQRDANNFYFYKQGASTYANVTVGSLGASDSIGGQRLYTGYDSGVANSVSCSGWFRSSGATGWINATYGGGIYMEDSVWVRTYGNKKFYVANTDFDSIQTSGGVKTTGDVTCGRNVGATGDVYAKSFYGNANVGGTGNAVNCPGGIYSQGTNWLYGPIITNSNSINAGSGTIDCGNINSTGSVKIRSGAAGVSSDGLTAISNKQVIGIGVNQVYVGNGSLGDLYLEASATRATGSIVAAGNVTAYSDRRVKANIKNIPDAINKVMQLNGVTYTRTDQEDKEKLHTGVIAQEVEAVLPEAVITTENGDIKDFKSVAYGNLVGLLIEAIKEQQSSIKDLKQQIDELKAR